MYKKRLAGLDVVLVLWYTDCTVKAAAARIPIHSSASSIYVSCVLYERTRLPSTQCILSMIEFDYGLPGESGLLLIPYSFSIKIY